jgi:hypothetical protein
VTYAAEVLADSPTWFAELDDTSGTTATDSSGNGQNGTYFNSPTLSATPLITVGHAVTFPGSNQSAGFTPSPSTFFDCTGSFTIEFWVKTSQAANQDPYLVNGMDTNSNVFMRVRLDNTTGAVLFEIQDSGASGHNCTGATPINDGVARHVVCTFNGTAAKIYLNGVQDGVLNATFTPAIHSPTMHIAQRRNAGTSSNFLNGTLDEVAYYKSTALSQARITAHYNAGIGSGGASTKVPIDSFAYGSSVYRRDTAVASSDAAVTALPSLFISSGGAKTATTSFVYHDSTLGRDRAIWAGDQVATSDNAYIAAPSFFV